MHHSSGVSCQVWTPSQWKIVWQAGIYVQLDTALLMPSMGWRSLFQGTQLFRGSDEDNI